MPDGQSLPSRKRGLLSFANTPNTGAPKPIVISAFVPDAAIFAASSLLTQSLFGMCTSSGMPTFTAAIIAGELTAWTCTRIPTFFASSRTARSVSSSFSLGPGTGVSAISPVYLMPSAAILRTSSRADSGVWFASRSDPDGMIRGPLIKPCSM